MHTLHTRSFQLLEMMIAIFLVVVCIAPIFRAYVDMNRAQFNTIRLHHRDHLVHLVYGIVMEQLYKQAISWEEILHSRPEKLERLNPLEEVAKQFKALSYEATYQLQIEKPKKDCDQANEFLLKFSICVADGLQKEEEPVSYHYYVYAWRELPSGQVPLPKEIEDVDEIVDTDQLPQVDPTAPVSQKPKRSAKKAAKYEN